MKRLLSPRQVAQSLGVSESSLKRWCDRGELPFERTAGGHRRIPVPAVVRFLRQHRRDVARPEILGLPEIVDKTTPAISSVELLAQALVGGDAGRSRGIIFEFFLAGQSVARICDELLTPALIKIGDLWHRGEVEIFQERRAVELIVRALHELRLTLENNEEAPVAIGASVEGDNYGLPTRMVELTLMDCGWRATSLGTSLPLGTLLSAVRQDHPQLLWLSASVIKDEAEFVESLRSLCECVPLTTKIVVGGRALPADLSDRVPSVTTCDDLRRLAQFSAHTLDLVKAG